MKIKCGDANPKGNIAMFFKGGCGKELDIMEAYRCTGCGGYFHLDCIFEHFEQEKEHDYSRNALKRIKDYIDTAGKDTLDKKIIGAIVDNGLERKKPSKDFGFPFNQNKAIKQ